MAPSGLPLAFFVAVLWAVIFVDVQLALAGVVPGALAIRAKRVTVESKVISESTKAVVRRQVWLTMSRLRARQSDVQA